tara:strand:+ start:1846 stop:2043 length:198 start_codon:yes stop_codon:yes gene_type:complete
MDIKEKEYIDSLSYEQLLSAVRFAPIGDPLFQGEKGEYWLKRMNQLRSKPDGEEMHVNASKSIGW